MDIDLPSYSTNAVHARIRRIESMPLARDLDELITNLAERIPDSLAWNFFESGETTTYAQLRHDVTRLACGLLSIGVRPGTHVGVMLPNVAAFPLTWLALARIGAVMVPINTRYTARELQYVLTDSESSYLIISTDYLDTLRDAQSAFSDLVATIVELGEGAPGGGVRFEQLLHEDGPMPVVLPSPVPDDLLNIQYTSGTTGFPKGCLLTQRYWLLAGKSHAFCDDRTYRRILISLPFFYMTAQWQFMMSLYQGATIYVAVRQSATRFMDWVREYGIDFCIIPLPVYKQPPSPLDAENALVRANIYGFPKDSHADLELRFGVSAREGYGMTEIGAGMFMPMEAKDMVGSGACGIPMPFRHYRIVDENGRDVRPGESGELIVRGPGILQGYYRKPEATAISFYGDWFRTGDLFRQDERGYYYIVGRTKDMIRRAGENIAAREVEAVILGLTEIAEVAVVGVADEVRGEEVKAYLVLRPEVSRDALPPQAIIDYCLGRLAVFKVPRYIQYRTTELPKTASGKVSKIQLLSDDSELLRHCWDRVRNVWL